MRLLSLILALSLSLAASAQTVSEHEMKAAYLYNFTRFIDWPADERANFNLCLLGEVELGEAMRKYEGRRIKDQRLVIARLSTMSPVRQCSLLFVGSSQLSSLAKINSHLADYPVLTVTDRQVPQPVAILLALEAEKLVFDLNLEHMQRARLKPQLSLLRLARKVHKLP